MNQKPQKTLKYIFFGIGACLTLSGCAKEEVFPDLGEKVASPIDVVASPSRDFFYVLNSDMDRTYNKGSILVIDTAGNKVSSVPTPRLGRSLTIVDTVLISTFNSSGTNSGKNSVIEGETPIVQLFDLADEKTPRLTQTFEIDCNPINAVGRSGYRYFAVSCDRGEILIGDFTNKTLKMVRNGTYKRRALYIDSKRGLLFAFVTSIGKNDQLLTDQSSWDKDFKESETPNEIPDRQENTARAKRQSTVARRAYQFILYDIEKESKMTDADESPFPFRSTDTTEALSEYRWMYFGLTNFDGTPDNPEGYESGTNKYYRTNFWSVQPDAEDEDSFYISHRGLGTDDKSPYANNIIKATITKDPRQNSESKIPLTKDIINFKRVYGFNSNQGDTKKVDYTSDFDLLDLEGKKTIVVNDFRDLTNFRKVGGGRFSISASTFEDQEWFGKIESTNSSDGFYQIAAGNNGLIATCSFYGNAVILLEVGTGAAIREVKRIN